MRIGAAPSMNCYTKLGEKTRPRPCASKTRWNTRPLCTHFSSPIEQFKSGYGTDLQGYPLPTMLDAAGRASSCQA